MMILHFFLIDFNINENKKCPSVGADGQGVKMKKCFRVVCWYVYTIKKRCEKSVMKLFRFS